MADDSLTIEINGKPLQARKGQMLIQVADEAGINIPRFCYHKKLSVAANCRMCLVEVEKAPKPLPACATPVMEGMKVFTHSPLAIQAQKGVMEFLLINHPLDCPICDQGGECELQDLAMGYGSGVSRYTENKRVVKDKDIGPLISTDMTRCIHCTRCVRFGEEIAGIRELGATGRGEFMRIGTYIEQSVGSELSGNVIDLCPVGALNAKPSRFSGRAWEMRQSASIAPHDCVGSNIYVHTLRAKVKRVVPRDNEALNETWLSDRDRFSYEALNSEARLTQPMIKTQGEWRATDWETALQFTADGLRRQLQADDGKNFGAWAAPHSTLEELYLLQKLLRGLGSDNIDHRLRQQDFSDQEAAPPMPWLGLDLQALERQQAFLLIGSNVRKEQPLAAHRLRKAVLRGASVYCINARAYDWHFPLAGELVASASELPLQLAGILAALAQASKTATAGAVFTSVLDGITPDAEQHAAAQALMTAGTCGSVILGAQASCHPQFSVLRALAAEIARLSGATFGYLPEAGNSAGAWLAGCVPHRDCAALPAVKNGAHFAGMLQQPLSAYLLLNVEPEFDTYNPQTALKVLQQAGFVVSLTPFVSHTMKQYADVLLPIGTFMESAGTFVNAEGRWQSVAGVSHLHEEVKPGWKVLRVLGNLLEVEGFEYNSAEEIKQELQQRCHEVELNNAYQCPSSVSLSKSDKTLLRCGDIAIYSGDALQRYAPALQQTPDAKQALAAVINSATAAQCGLSGAQRVNVIQADASCVMDLQIEASIPAHCVWIAGGTVASAALGSLFGPVRLEAV